MNVFVIATTLQIGGGITIYKQFLAHLPEHIGEDKYYVFVNERLPQDKIEGVQYILMPILSKLKRTLIEGKMLRSEAGKLGVKPDVVVSLQNNGYKCFNNCRHIVYFHQSLPLYPGFYNPFKYTERILFNYKHIFPHVVKKTWVKNTQFVVQTSVVKNRFVSYFGIPKRNVHICFPDIEKIDVSQCKVYNWGDNKYHLIFVGDGLKYRNGNTLVKAVRILKEQNLLLAEKIRIHVTSSVEISPQLHKEIMLNNVDNNFVFEGVMEHDILLSYYKSATALLFPSSIETVGLPLLEASILGLPIVAANVDYAHEVIRDYDGVKYADVHDYEAWAKNIIELCENSRRFNTLSQERKSDWEHFFDLVK